MSLYVLIEKKENFVHSKRPHVTTAVCKDGFWKTGNRTKTTSSVWRTIDSSYPPPPPPQKKKKFTFL